MLRILRMISNSQQYQDNTYEFIYKGTTVAFFENRNVVITGSAKNAALAVFLYMFQQYEYWRVHKDSGIYLGGIEAGGVNLCWDKEFSITYEPFVGVTFIPEDFLKLEKEFNRIKKLMVFI